MMFKDRRTYRTPGEYIRTWDHVDIVIFGGLCLVTAVCLALALVTG